MLSQLASDDEYRRRYSRHEWTIRLLAKDNDDEFINSTTTVSESSSSLRTPRQQIRKSKKKCSRNNERRRGLRYADYDYNYFTSPLHQGYGTHYATLWVGTPPQRKSVIVDTGSHYTAFPCTGCLNCGEEHHTDLYFNPDASSSFRALSCGGCITGKCGSGSSSAEDEAGGADARGEEGMETTHDDKCIFDQTYTEGSSWMAYESIDKVYIGSRTFTTTAADADASSNSAAASATSVTHPLTTDFLFGCQTKETGMFVTQLADGIMGMSAHPATLPRVMYDQGKIPANMFALCYKRELHVSKRGIVAGMLTLGGADARADIGPMVYAKNVGGIGSGGGGRGGGGGWYTVFVKSIHVREKGGQRVATTPPDGSDQILHPLNVDLTAMNSGKGVIIDSGTTDTYLHTSLAESFNSIWKVVVPAGGKYMNKPMKLSQDELLLLPTILVEFAAYDDFTWHAKWREHEDTTINNNDNNNDQKKKKTRRVVLAIPATHYMEYSPVDETYTPRIYFTESKGSVIGANAMQGHNILFDSQNSRIGFAESTCVYQDEESSSSGSVSSNLDVVMSVDCKLGVPSLRISCSDSADLSSCNRKQNKKRSSNREGENNNFDTTAIDGLEIWSRIVIAPGLSQGKTCEEVSMEQNVADGGGQMEVNCDGKGVCQEVRKCIISCANALAHGTASKNTALTPIGSCGALTWSACDYTCTQTRINSILMSDGKCHEDKSSEITRSCHVQACGRSDPCRVPFVVHAIIKIRGAVASHWTKHAEEIFAESFTATLNINRKSNENRVEPGDIVVLSASPWRASDDTVFGTKNVENDEDDEELGMQLVVETSIFNYNTEIPKFKRHRDVPMATCRDSDVRPLAIVALNMHKKLADPNFIDLMVEHMKLDESLGEKQMSPFYYTFEDRKLAQESFVVTSWTIKSDVGTRSSTIDLDAFGIVRLNILFLTLISLMIAFTCWRLRLWSVRKKYASTMAVSAADNPVNEHRRRGKYSRVKTTDNEFRHQQRREIVDSDSMMGVASAYNDDVQTILTGMTGYSSSSDTAPEDSESFRSIGSLSTYLARTSRVHRRET